MAEATGIEVRQLTNVGEDSLYEIKAIASSGETITIPSTEPVSTSSKIKIVSANNITDGTCLGAIDVIYDDAHKRFTYTETGASDEEVRIEYRIEKKKNFFLFF